MSREKVGILGGSFNPIHKRHIEMGLAAQREFKLDRLIFLPTGNPPHKKDGLENAKDRYEMVRLSVSGLKDCEASRLELDREGTIYTVDTLSLMKKSMPNASFYYIIGEDTLYDLPNWRKPDKVFSLCQMIVCCRTSSNLTDTEIVRDMEKRGAKFLFLSLEPSPVSSTGVREALARGEEPCELMPQAMEYIRIFGLYGLRSSPGNFKESYELLKEKLSEKRLVHSLLVSYIARKLAARHGENVERAALAALLHDCAKCIPLQEMQELAKQGAYPLDDKMINSGNLLHGYAGAVMAQKEFGVTDQGILNAIRWHTTGRTGMLPLDMIIYLADKIEPSRQSYPMLEKIREAAEDNLFTATRLSLESSIRFVESKETVPHPLSMQAYEWLKRF